MHPKKEERKTFWLYNLSILWENPRIFLRCSETCASLASDIQLRIVGTNPRTHYLEIKTKGIYTCILVLKDKQKRRNQRERERLTFGPLRCNRDRLVKEWIWSTRSFFHVKELCKTLSRVVRCCGGSVTLVTPSYFISDT